MIEFNKYGMGREIQPHPYQYFFDMFATKTIDEAFKVYERQVENLGFYGAGYGIAPILYIKSGLSVRSVFKVSEERDSKFLQHYQEANFEQDDFTVNRLRKGENKVMDWWKVERQGQLSQAEKHVITVARDDYGVQNGITIPLMNNAYGIAAASVWCKEKNGRYTKLLKENYQSLIICTQAFHKHVMTTSRMHHYFLSSVLNRLTEKEKYVIRHLVSGAPMKNIQHITSAYAEKLVKTLKIKFGDIRTQELIYHTGVLMLLDEF